MMRGHLFGVQTLIIFNTSVPNVLCLPVISTVTCRDTEMTEMSLNTISVAL